MATGSATGPGRKTTSDVIDDIDIIKGFERVAFAFERLLLLMFFCRKLEDSVKDNFHDRFMAPNLFYLIAFAWRILAKETLFDNYGIFSKSYNRVFWMERVPLLLMVNSGITTSNWKIACLVFGISNLIYLGYFAGKLFRLVDLRLGEQPFTVKGFFDIILLKIEAGLEGMKKEEAKFNKGKQKEEIVASNIKEITRKLKLLPREVRKSTNEEENKAKESHEIDEVTIGHDDGREEGPVTADQLVEVTQKLKKDQFGDFKGDKMEHWDTKIMRLEHELEQVRRNWEEKNYIAGKLSQHNNWVRVGEELD